MKNKTSNLLTASLIIFFSVSSCSQFKKDYSLNTEDYIKIGMPDHNKKWTGDDYSEANITLSTLKMDAPMSLPRKNSAKSGVLFERFVNDENIAFVYDTTIPLKVRAYLIQHYPAIIGEIEHNYTFEHKGKPVYTEEILELKIFELNVQDKMLELARIIDKTDDETLSGFKEGMKMVKYNYFRLIPELLKAISDNEQIKSDETKNLCTALSESVQINSEMFSAEEKRNLIAEFENSKKQIKSGDFSKMMSNCVNNLSN